MFVSVTTPVPVELPLGSVMTSRGLGVTAAVAAPATPVPVSVTTDEGTRLVAAHGQRAG